MTFKNNTAHPYEGSVFFKTIDDIINTVERKRFSLTQVTSSKWKLQRADYLCEEASFVLRMIQVDMDVGEKTAWEAMRTRAENAKNFGAARYLDAAEGLWQFAVHVTKHHRLNLYVSNQVPDYANPMQTGRTHRPLLAPGLSKEHRIIPGRQPLKAQPDLPPPWLRRPPKDYVPQQVRVDANVDARAIPIMVTVPMHY
ncbi:hypothetical protein EVJ58_g4349 [Rhodofomes roseus]|uniref:Uncharacterized protein n=1 Tax=Rhodofomes roseus TaxID=34475 RepID=A0A4Y9YGK4_9APHY|nr:hypothetical protein EVJ58_g4349 [Rhodofomes roseus]